MSIYAGKTIYTRHKMLINCQMLAGEKLEHLQEAHIGIEGSQIAYVGEGFVSGAQDLRDLLAVPGLVNAHTHLGDSFAKDACTGLRVREAVGKKGRKWELYETGSQEEIISAMRDSAKEMLSSGVTAYADFREGGHEGLTALRTATKGLPIRTFALGRDLSGRFEECRGLGLNLYQIDQIPKNRKELGDKVVAVHAGEASGEVEAALDAKPDIIVHYTTGTEEAIRKTTKKKISVVVCPRSNASLKAGFPPVRKLLDAGVNVALGTDNVMINSPDMWREMEFLYKASQLFEGLTPKEVFKAASINGGHALRTNSGALKKGRTADIVFLDINAPNMRGSRDILASLVTRCHEGNVRKTLIEGIIAVNK
jgi:cytosine/adenosine deaminase-related metal-dependent hydrolase